MENPAEKTTVRPNQNPTTFFAAHQKPLRGKP
jgi:hypothetical protein